MDMFDTKRRDHPDTGDFMDPKKPPFGGPNSKKDFVKNKRKSLDKYQRVVERNPDFEGGVENHNYDTTWKAVTRDRASRDANKKQADVMYAKNTVFAQKIEEGKIFRFDEFVKVNEELEQGIVPEGGNPLDDAGMPGGPEAGMEPEENPDLGYEVDEEQLNTVIEKFSDDIQEILDKIKEEFELEDDKAACDLFCAAVEKISSGEGEEEETEEGGEGKEGEEGAGEETEPGA